MADTETISPPETGPPAVERVDIVVATPRSGSASLIEPMIRVIDHAMGDCCSSRKWVIYQVDDGSSGAETPGDSIEGLPRARRLVPPIAPGETPTRATLVRSVFEQALRLQAACCVMLDPDPNGLDAKALANLVEPVMSGAAEFVGAYYSRPRFSGPFTSSVVYPFTRALYGKRLRYPIAGEFSCAPRFMSDCLTDSAWGDGTRLGVDLWLALRALTGGFALGQAHVGSRPDAGFDGDDLSIITACVLSALFAEAERRTGIWQRVRGSEPVPLYGEPAPPVGTAPLDVKGAIEGFRLAQQHLAPVWAEILPPTALLELRRLARRPDDGFVMPDSLWAQLVYRFALTYHARSMSRDHLLRAFTPLYLAWLGSHATELDRAAAVDDERRVEQLCLQFEREKPYLISGWRWPDRFNP